MPVFLSLPLGSDPKDQNLNQIYQIQALVVAGGNNGSANLASMLTLLPGAGAWTTLAALPRSLYGAGALLVGGRLRLTGGRDDGGSYRSEVGQEQNIYSLRCDMVCEGLCKGVGVLPGSLEHLGEDRKPAFRTSLARRPPHWATAHCLCCR